MRTAFIAILLGLLAVGGVAWLLRPSEFQDDLDSPLYGSTVAASLQRFREEQVDTTDLSSPTPTSAVRIHGIDSSDLITLGKEAFALGEYRLALAYYAEAVQTDASNWLTYCYQGDAHLRLGEHIEAIQAYSRALAVRPDFSVPYDGMGTAYLNMGDKESARKAFEMALEINPNDKAAKYQLEKLGSGND